MADTGGATPIKTETADTKTMAPLRPSSAVMGSKPSLPPSFEKITGVCSESEVIIVVRSGASSHMGFEM